ncbi:hypothetical protein [Roseomonas populi]|uniref:Transposase DDE domain-containing protein n=1 Tax=Roseomonas populi TaxID=3121582 RepID=A0ABT1X2N5_9PROT|nr:hypothetical protein [Roseomonas pecuniae]MCR0982385.1 hypothetical protein [Roseomonas pecuniae]
MITRAEKGKFGSTMGTVAGAVGHCASRLFRQAAWRDVPFRLHDHFALLALALRPTCPIEVPYFSFAGQI